MRSPSRMIVAVLLAFGLALTVSCSSKSEPSRGPDPDHQGNGQPNVTVPKPELVQANYETDVAKHVIPAGPVSGVLAGEAVVAEVVLEGKMLLFRPAGAAASGESWRVSLLDLPPEAQRGEACRVVIPVDANLGVSLFVEFPKPVALKQWELFSFRGWEPTKHLGWQGGCALTLELGKREKGRLTGKIVLALGEIDAQNPAHRKSYLAGTFEADCPRQPTDPPGVEDVPLVNGTVTVRGATPNATLRTGFASAPTEKAFPLGGTDIQIGEPVNPPRWTQTSPDPPRVSSLIAGNGKDVPSRYEHSKLSPGRYLVFAQLKDGPAAWKWVTVQAQSTIAVDLVIDAAQVGGVEVSVPLGVLGKVQMIPAEEAGQPPVGPELFLGIAFQMNLEHDIIANKALFRNLAPGRYDVRAGGRARVVEIVAGKTVELDLDKPEASEPKK